MCGVNVPTYLLQVGTGDTNNGKKQMTLKLTPSGFQLQPSEQEVMHAFNIVAILCDSCVKVKLTWGIKQLRN